MAMTTAEAPLTVTERAAARLVELGRKPENACKHLRLEILAGGCSGFQRVFKFDTPQADDVKFGPVGAELLIDPVSLDLIKGSVVDFVDSLAGAEFVLQNPSAKSSCGCGASFNL